MNSVWIIQNGRNKWESQVNLPLTTRTNHLFFLIHSATAAANSYCIPTNASTSSVITVTRCPALTARPTTRTSSSRWPSATPTSRHSNSSSGHNMRPRWNLPSQRQTVHHHSAAPSPGICRWWTESPTFCTASRASFGGTSRCGRPPSPTPPTVAYVVRLAIARSPCGTPLNPRPSPLTPPPTSWISRRCGIPPPN